MFSPTISTSRNEKYHFSFSKYTTAEKYLIFSTLTYFQYFYLLNNSVVQISSLIFSKSTEKSENTE